ncbi:MAG: glycerophosphodiester phosphodiesterase family protein [Ignavibacteriales bacterium]
MPNSVIKCVLILICAFSMSAYSKTVKIIAHRGVPSLAPENTLSSFKKAIELNADYYELDVWYSRDDSLMVIHDPTVNNTTNDTGKVNNLTYWELKKLDAGSWFNKKFSGERIPTLYETLLLAKESVNKIRVCIHIVETRNSVVGRIINLVKEMNMEDQVILMCFEYDKLGLAKQLAPEIKTLWLLPEPVSKGMIEKCISNKVDVLGARPEDIISQEMMDTVHQNKLEVWKWTVDDPNEMRRLIKVGADGIITNFTQVLQQILQSATNTNSPFNGPARFGLEQNYPNPFNQSTIIQFDVPEKGHCTITVFNIQGQKVRELLNRDYEAGIYIVPFNAKDLSSGDYFYSIDFKSADNSVSKIITKKMVLLK